MYTLTINKETIEFETKKEANKNKRELIKKYDLKPQRGFYGNAKTGIELDTNY